MPVDYITLRFPFNASGSTAGELLSTAWWFKIATHRLLNVLKQQQTLPITTIGWVNTFKDIVYGIIPNYRYATGVITLMMGIYESCRKLGIDFKRVELSDWLMFQQGYLEYSVKSITLKTNYKFHITTIKYDGSISRVVINPTIPENYEKLLSVIITKQIKHTGRVVIDRFGVRNNQLWIHGEVQVTIPLDIYYEHMARHKRNNGKLIGGVDVNTDRINLAIVDENGGLRNYKTFWFSETIARGFPKDKARIIIGSKIHEMLDYAYNNGVKTLFLEDPEVLGRLKLMWVRSGDRKHENYNYKVMVFRSSIIERIALKAPLYSIEVKYVNPGGTTNSEEHKDIMRRYGLDKHTASAYLIAIRGLGLSPRAV